MPPPRMQITGERTVPGIPHENYWFRRHEVGYERLTDTVEGRSVLEVGCGEGYGAALLARSADQVTALDYDACTVAHVRTAYPAIAMVRGNAVALPFRDRSFDVVVGLQVVEHLWDQDTFVAECVRVLRRGGRLVLSTPNRLTFPPGNLYHPGELDRPELLALVSAHADVEELVGLHHGPRITEWEAGHGSVVDAQVGTAPEAWATHVRTFVAAVSTRDFDCRSDHLDESLDLVVTARVRAG